jgi:elongation factor 3
VSFRRLLSITDPIPRYDHKHNTWVPREELLEKGFSKVVGQFDDLESSREGAGQRETSLHLVRKHLEDIGLDGDIAQYNEISGLSGGQKIKLVIAACLWNNPQICVLDEPSNFLDREALGGLAVAIRDWAGAVVIISHNDEFITALCAYPPCSALIWYADLRVCTGSEIWNVDGGRMTHKGKQSVVDDAFADARLTAKSGANTPAKSTPGASAAVSAAASASGTPAGSGGEGTGSPMPKKKKKKLTRNQCVSSLLYFSCRAVY